MSQIQAVRNPSSSATCDKVNPRASPSSTERLSSRAISLSTESSWLRRSRSLVSRTSEASVITPHLLSQEFSSGLRHQGWKLAIWVMRDHRAESRVGRTFPAGGIRCWSIAQGRRSRARRSFFSDLCVRRCSAQPDERAARGGANLDLAGALLRPVLRRGGCGPGARAARRAEPGRDVALPRSLRACVVVVDDLHVVCDCFRQRRRTLPRDALRRDALY